MVQRLLIFFIGIPVIFSLVIFLPFYKYFAFNIAVVIFSALGAAELSVLLAQKKLRIIKIEAAVLGAVPPAAMLLTVCFGFNDLLLPAIIAVAVACLLMSGIFSRGEALDDSISRIAAGFAVLLYPGILMTWIVRLSHLEKNTSIIILTFLCIVFSSDSAAWAAGKLFGRKNQGFIPVSQSKSIAGFTGGLIVPTLVGLGAALVYPEVFIPDHSLNAPVAGAVLGLLTGIAGTLGDLGESVIKRSSGLKDSGGIIPGRGGVLDSIDSITFAAPVFYLAFRLFFIP
ncbi:MAG: phosphatidate cytidylyltransferase [Treponema sp.]|nr:phosphatidate cytidylyltransferase [Treponema sp.]